MVADPRYEFVRQPCALCGGVGKLPMKHPRGFYMEYQQHRRKPSCGECLGSGYHDVRRKRIDAGWDTVSVAPHDEGRTT